MGNELLVKWGHKMGALNQIVLEFKAALKTDAAKMATEHINTLINITEKRH